jgi:hypothetical protein
VEPKPSNVEAGRMKRTLKPLAALAAVGATLVLAACGGSDSSDSSTATTGGGAPSSSASSNEAVKYSQCMREHGVTNFPDPQNGRLTLRAGAGTDVDPNSSTFKSAQKACQSLAPSGAQTSAGGSNAMQASVLKFAECMRKNGVRNFPDPQVSGGRVTMQPGAGVDPDSEAFKAAQSKCSSLLSGATQGATP